MSSDGRGLCERAHCQSTHRRPTYNSLPPSPGRLSIVDLSVRVRQSVGESGETVGEELEESWRGVGGELESWKRLNGPYSPKGKMAAAYPPVV